MKSEYNKRANFSDYHAYILCMLAILVIVAGSAGASQGTTSTPVDVRIYSINPDEIFGISQLKQEPSISDVQIIDLSLIPQIEVIFGAYAGNKMNRESIAEMKALGARLPKSQLQRLAKAQMSFFDLQTRYDITLDDLPVVIFEQDKSLYLYNGNDAYRGFVLWQQSKR